MNKKLLMFCIVGMLVFSTNSFINVGAADGDYVEVEIVEYMSSEEVDKESIQLSFEESQELVEKLLESTNIEEKFLLMQEYNLLPEGFNLDVLKQSVIDESENVVVTDEVKQEMENIVNDETNKNGKIHIDGLVSLALFEGKGLILRPNLIPAATPHTVLLWKVNDGDMDILSLLTGNFLYSDKEIDSSGVILGFYGFAGYLPWRNSDEKKWEMLHFVFGHCLSTVYKTGDDLFSSDSLYKNKNVNIRDNAPFLSRFSKIFQYLNSFPMINRLLQKPFFRLLNFQ